MEKPNLWDTFRLFDTRELVYETWKVNQKRGRGHALLVAHLGSNSSRGVLSSFHLTLGLSGERFENPFALTTPDIGSIGSALFRISSSGILYTRALLENSHLGWTDQKMCCLQWLIQFSSMVDPVLIIFFSYLYQSI